MRKLGLNTILRRSIALALFACLLIFAGNSGEQQEIAGGFEVKTVVIDAGHGGHDGGCSGKFSKEKHIALKLALKLGKKIEKHYPGIKVIYTRDKDVFVELHERAAIANRAEADLFISIHCNAATAAAYGTETYVMGLHVEGSNLAVAKRENSAILLEEDYEENYDGFDPNSPEAHILLSLFQSAFLNQSIQFAELVEAQFKSIGRKSRGVRQAGFLVLHKTAMPSVLIESGFLTNKNEEAFLRDEKNQEKMATCMFNAFSAYKAKQEGSVPKVIKPDETPEKVGPENTPPKEETETEEVVDQNVFLTVQVAASKTKLDSNDPRFKGEDMHEIEEGGYYKYQFGRFTSYEEAEKSRLNLRSKGFKDCFVVAYKDGEKITVSTARKILENQ